MLTRGALTDVAAIIIDKQESIIVTVLHVRSRQPIKILEQFAIKGTVSLIADPRKTETKANRSHFCQILPQQCQERSLA